MLFEIRTDAPPVSENWLEASELFHQGKTRQAYQLAKAQRENCVLDAPNDFLLNIEIARACSLNRTYLALVRMANRRFPDDPMIQLYHSRSLLTRSLFTEGIQHLKSLEPTLGVSHPDLWVTGMANMYASAGFYKSCKEQLSKVAKSPDELSPLALYSLSCAYEGMLEWEQAIEYAEHCVAAAPRWSRARGYLANCLLARGRDAEAIAHLDKVREQGIEEAIVDATAAMLPMAQGEFSLACERMGQVLQDWPDADIRHWVRRTLCILLVEQGDYEAARRIRSELGDAGALPEIPETPTDRHKFIPLPLIAQNHNQCVPTSVAMSLFPQGEVFEPNVMFREMQGREGIQMWRMRQWAEERGFEVVPVQLEKEAVVALIDLDIPLIGTLVYPFSSHVEVVCGYNLDLETLYVRDPGMWAPAAWPWEMAFPRYELHGGLLAIIPKNDATKKQVAENWRASEGTALLNLSKAIAEGDLAAAEDAYHRIDDQSPCAMVRNSYGSDVVISPGRYAELMKQTLSREEANLISRFRALLTLGTDDAESELEKILESDEDGQFRQGARRYISLLQQMHQGDWEAALETINQLLVRGGGVANFWEMKSDILAELGEEDASREALDLALELQPLQSSLREKKLRRDVYSVTYQEFLDQFEQLALEDPESKRLLISRASILRKGLDGKAYEQAAMEGLRWFPRFPALYAQLMDWYGFQGRSDLHKKMLEKAQQMLPEEFPDPEKTEGGEPKADDEAVPEKKEDLLRVIWVKPESRREKALQVLLKMQNDGQLKWFESSALTANQLLMVDPELTAEQQEARVKELLPKNLPGCPQWYAEHLTGILTEENSDARTSKLVSGWLEEAIPELRKFPNLWFNRILLLEQALDKERAIEELQQLVEAHPAMESALYRLGMVKYQQQDYLTAKKHFESALEVNPGLFGAMRMLRDVCGVLDDREGGERCLKMLRQNLPYSVSYLHAEASLIAENSIERAIQFLDEQKGEFPEDRVDVMKAALYVGNEKIAAAQELLKGRNLEPDQDEDYFEELLQVRIDLAFANEDREALSRLSDLGLERWPDSARLKIYKSQCLAKDDPNGARRLLMEVLMKGDGDEEICWRYLVLSNQSPEEAAKRVILKAEDDVQPNIAITFAKVFAEPELLSWQESYLTWARQKYPDYDTFIWRLSLHYHLQGETGKAIQIAEELLEKNPENPEAIRTLGRCLIDEDPKRALPLLKQAVSVDRSADYLFDLARCQQLAGNQDESTKLHWEVLQSNPYFAASWTNLLFFGANKQQLWPYLEPMLKRGYGANDEYFAVSAVLLATELGQSLPPEWFHVALHRWEVLKTNPPFADERLRLSRALLAWKSKRPHDVPEHAELPSGFWASLMARFRWPGRKWIPAKS